MAFHLSTTTYEYHDEAKSGSEASWAGTSSYRLTRRVRRKDGATLVLATDLATMVSEGILPNTMDQLIAGSPAVANRNLGAMRCDGWDWSVDAREKTLTANITWSTPEFCDTRKANQVIFPGNISYQTVTRMARIYRRSWTTNPPALSNSSGDIGGTAVGGAGATQTVLVNQVRIRMVLTQSAHVAAGYMNQAVVNFLPYAGTQTNQIFAGFPAGSLICEGVNIQQTRMPYYDIVFDFLYDEWYHHEQVAATGNDGRPNWSGGNVATVQWQRLARTTADFNSLFSGDTNLQNRMIRGWVS